MKIKYPRRYYHKRVDVMYYTVEYPVYVTYLDNDDNPSFMYAFDWVKLRIIGYMAIDYSEYRRKIKKYWADRYKYEKFYMTEEFKKEQEELCKRYEQLLSSGIEAVKIFEEQEGK